MSVRVFLTSSVRPVLVSACVGIDLCWYRPVLVSAALKGGDDAACAAAGRSLHRMTVLVVGVLPNPPPFTMCL